MNHSYQPSIGADVCAHCKFPAIAHTDKAVCETCPNIGPVEVRYGNMLMCADCWQKEQNLTKENMTPEKQSARIAEMNHKLETSRSIDASITVRSDLFNAATMSIVELKKTVDNNPAIENKPYHLASELMTRFTHFKKVIFDAQQQIVDATNSQKAIQVYLNNLANQLRAKEREKLKIADINYQPTSIKPAKPASIKTRKPVAINRADLKKYASELGVSDFTLQMLCVSKGITPQEAAEQLRKSINAARTNQPINQPKSNGETKPIEQSVETMNLNDWAMKWPNEVKFVGFGEVTAVTVDSVDSKYRSAAFNLSDYTAKVQGNTIWFNKK